MVQLRPVPAPTDVLHQMSVCGVTSTQPGDTSIVPLLALYTAESTLVPAGPKLTPAEWAATEGRTWQETPE